MDAFLADVDRIYQEKEKVVVAVSEGIHYADGTFVSEAKKSALRALDGGRTWRALIASHMSNLRRVRISFDNIASGSAPAASEPAVSTGEDTLAREKSPADTLNSAL